MAGRGLALPEQAEVSEIRSALELHPDLGESPVWHGGEGALYWVDVRKPSINRFDPGTGANEEFAAPEPVHAIALTRSRRLLAVL